MQSDTIAAISTPMGEGGIAVIRISGSESIEIADRLFDSNKKLTDVPSHTVHYGHIVDRKTMNRIDEVLVTVMRGPRSFTKEDVVEISCHGGIISVRKILDSLLSEGVRLAEPGEFTKRAFLNGRIDLSQAEAVIDLIRAKSDRAFDLALKQSEGMLSIKVKETQHELLELMAHIEVNIDYPEHDVEEMTHKFIKDKCFSTIEKIELLLKWSEQGKMLREGIETVIVGRPNVGKSSLLNALSKDNRAIVTDIPGTTRDVIEEYVTINGIALKLLDTAGLRETDDLVEQIGVERSKQALRKADLILFVINGGEPLHQDEKLLMDEIKQRQVIIVVNKTDLPLQVDIDELKENIDQNYIVFASVKEQKGIDELEQAVTNMFFQGEIESNDFTYVSNVRHIQSLRIAKQSLLDAIEATGQSVPIDMIQIDIRNAWESLGEIIGNSAPDTLLDQIFSQFCLGK